MCCQIFHPLRHLQYTENRRSFQLVAIARRTIASFEFFLSTIDPSLSLPALPRFLCLSSVLETPVFLCLRLITPVYLYIHWTRRERECVTV